MDEWQIQFKDLTIQYIVNTPVFKQLETALNNIEKSQMVLYALNTQEESQSVKILKIGTVLSLAFMGKAYSNEGKNFTKEDWVDIADKVAQYGILTHGEAYTVFVFKLYAEYIDMSVELNRNHLREDQVIQIENLSLQLKDYIQSFEDGNIKETILVEESLWICLEAMLKLLSAYISYGISEEFGDLLISVNDFILQYGRLKLYKREQELLEGYLNHQEYVDVELENRFKDYINSLTEEANTIKNLIENAFAEDLCQRLRNSSELARKAGVKNDEILDSINKIDDFFM